MVTKRIFFVRHGFFDSLDGLIGDVLVLLAERKIKEIIRSETFSVFTSNVNRCKESAELIAGVFDVTIQVNNGLDSEIVINIDAISQIINSNKTDNLILVVSSEIIRRFPRFFVHEKWGYLINQFDSIWPSVECGEALVIDWANGFSPDKGHIYHLKVK